MMSLILSFIFAFHCSPDSVQNPISSICKGYAIIVPTERTNLLMLGVDSISKLWIPPDSLIERGAKFINTHAFEMTQELRSKLCEYYLQIVGIKSDTGLLIYYNFIHNPPDDWQSHFVFVFGGGENYFHIIYDISNDNIKKFYVNSPK